MNPYHALPKVPIVHGRQTLILEKCKGKRVLHLGCVDSGLMEERYQQNQLMHQKLAGVAGELWGTDIDASGIAFLREHGYQNLLVADVCFLDKVDGLKGQFFDVVLASEVIEHLDNPGLFLQSVKGVMKPGYTRLIITVPNAYRVSTLLSLLRGVEFIHPDHNYWFSYVTINNLVRKNGFTTLETFAYTYDDYRLFPTLSTPRKRHSESPEGGAVQGAPNRSFWLRLKTRLRTTPKRLFLSFLYARTPFWGDGIILIAQVPGNGSGSGEDSAPA